MFRNVSTLVLLLACTVAVQAQDRGPSTPAEREQAFRLAKFLEQEPLSPEAKDARHWLTVWVATVPDITVKVCGEFMSPLLAKDKNYSAEIFVQSMYSATAFLIEHPEKAQDEEAQYLAGLEGALRAYEAIRLKKPKVRWEVLDQLIVKRDAGELPAYVHEHTPKCTS